MGIIKQMICIIAQQSRKIVEKMNDVFINNFIFKLKKNNLKNSPNFISAIKFTAIFYKILNFFVNKIKESKHVQRDNQQPRLPDADTRRQGNIRVAVCIESSTSRRNTLQVGERPRKQ